MMYISYERLWKLLLERGMKKTDLLTLCGISSRTLSKLSKDQNVNTDTLLEVCEGLDCRLEDIMELRREEDAPTLYRAFCMQQPAFSDEHCANYDFMYHGKRILLKKTHRQGDKRTIIRCGADALTWEQIYPLGIHPVYEKERLCDDSFYEKDAVCIIVISGKLVGFQGLDDGIFLSWRNVPKPGARYIYVMSEPRLKQFTLPDEREAAYEN